jgi:hypothetical protein
VAKTKAGEDVQLLTEAQALARIKKEVASLQEDIYAQAGDAFCHHALEILFDLDSDEALEACAVGGQGDKGLDAFWLDEQGGRVVLVQAKYSSSAKKSFDRQSILQLESAFVWLKRLGETPSPKVRGEVLEAARQLHELRQEDPDYPIDLYCVCIGKFTDAAVDQADAFNDEHGDDHIAMHLVGLTELTEAENERLSRDAAPVGSEIQLKIRDHFEFQPAPEAPRAVVATIDGAELAAIERRYQYRIFQRNVRYYLKQTQKVNKSMSRTLEDPSGRQNFWYYNNGIAIVCDAFRTEKDEHGDWHVFVKNLQIVNGCQTTTTLGANIDKVKDAKSPAYVLVRIIESENDRLQRDITLFNNRQNAVRDRDLLSNDRTQDRLQLEFDEMELPWFYERKRGEWNARIAASPVLKARYGNGKRRIDNEPAAQAYMAFFHDPADARARKRLLFVPQAEQGYYDRIFQDDTTPEHLLVPFLLSQFIAERKREYQRKVKAIDRDALSVEDKRLLAQNWLRFADQFILGAIAFYLRQRIKLDQDHLAQLLGDDFEAVASRAYNRAVRDLAHVFHTKTKEAEQRRQPFSAANFVKGNWEDVHDHLVDEWAYREEAGEDVFEGIDLLEE